MAASPFAVVDIGSNSARIVVYEREASSHLRIVASARASLRLVEALDGGDGRVIGRDAMERAREALVDFAAIAAGAGARRILPYATAAVREAKDGPRFGRMAARILRAKVRILDGEQEAYFGFLGAVRGVHARSGLLFDLGGGSLQTTLFRDRERRRSASVPLGALRLALRFIEHDPPTEKEIRHLRRHVEKFLEELRLRPLRPGDSLVGTGGTVRNLAKIEGFREAFGLPRVHGHRLSLESLRQLEEDLSGRPRARNEEIVGLSKDRADSIVAGAVVIRTLCEWVEADEIVVSGQGLREGLAYAAIGAETVDIERVRASSLRAMLERFGADASVADTRAALASAVFERLAPPDERRVLSVALGVAARSLDVGRAVDYFDRHEHAARIVLASEMEGFTHAEIMRGAAILHVADEEGISLDAYAPHVLRRHRGALERAATSLLLADDLLERAPSGTAPRVTLQLTSARVIVRPTRVKAWRSRGLADRFYRAFGKDLSVVTGRESR